ncbi:MAG: Ig-like domain repeat protein [Methanosphaera sp.]|nr:Ig-like domain repeat protein [Methanosphaera sp.]
MYFYQNHAGIGAGIRNQPTGVLYVENCTFDNQTKSVSTGNFGTAIYNNGTAYVNNIYVLNNYARWGSVTNDKELYISNSTFEGGVGYDGTSTYKNGPTIYVNTGTADQGNVYESQGLITKVENCNFINNQQCDINVGKADISVNNCTFNHSTGIYITNGTGGLTVSQNYTNNQFIDIQESTMFTSMTSTTKPAFAIHSLANYNITIENNTIDVPNKKYGYAIHITNNTLVKNNTMNNVLRINGANATVIDNTITSRSDTTIAILVTAARNATIINNTLYAGAVYGDASITGATTATTIEGNLPTVPTLTITDENYPEYFDENSVLKTDVVANGTKIIFSGDLINKDFVFDNTRVLVTAEATSKLINATITTQNNAVIFLQNVKINNTKNDKGYVILLDTEDNVLKNTSITVDTDKELQAIKIEKDLNTINNCTINMTAAAGDIVWSENYNIGNVPTVAVFIRSSDNFVNNTKIFVYGTSVAEGASSPTVDGLDIQSKTVGEYVVGNELRNTRINVTGGSYVYGLNIARAKDTYTTMTYFIVNSTNCAYALQIGDSMDNELAGYVTSYADNLAYGAYITAMASGITSNTNFSKLYIQAMDAPQVVGVAVDGASGVELANASYTISGGDVKVVDIHKDYMGNTPENIFINALKITVTNDDEASEFMTISNSNNVTITNSNMTSTAGKGITLTDVTEATVVGNYINANNIIGGNAAVISNLEAVIEDNTPSIVLLTDDTYSDIFDENGHYILDATVIGLAGDLHNKDLIFDKTVTVNLTNTGDYTIYDGTVKLYDLDPETPSTTQTTINVVGVNFNNTDKMVFDDQMTDKTKRTVKFANSTIAVTGDDIVAFNSNNTTPISLEIATSDITMTGNKVLVVNFNGLNRTQSLNINGNVIDVSAVDSAIIVNASKATARLYTNNITQKATESITAIYDNCTISSYNFRYNNIQSEGDNVCVLQYFKNDTTSAYISDNNMTLTSPNPITAINISAGRSAYVQNNNIIVNAENGEIPVVYANGSITVQNNYILAYDVAGNDAVSTKGTNSRNSPNATTPTQSFINVEDVTAKLGQTTTITAIVTDAKDNAIPRGTVTFIDNTGKTLAVVDVVDGQASFDVSYNKQTNLEVTASFTNNIYFTDSECVFNLDVTKDEVTITLDEVTLVPAKTTTLTARIVDSEGNNINVGKVVFKVNGKTVKDENGKVVYAKVVDGVASVDYVVPNSMADKNVTILVEFMGSSQYDKATVEEQVSVAKKQATMTINEIPEQTVGSTVTISANIVDSDNNPVSEGKVVFKINGKTLKDENGKVIYAKVINGVATIENYDLGSLKANVYQIQAVFTSSTFDKAQANATLTVVN